MRKADEILLREAYSRSPTAPEIGWKRIAAECAGDEGLYLSIWKSLEKACAADLSDLRFHIIKAIFHAADNGMLHAAAEILKRMRTKKIHPAARRWNKKAYTEHVVTEIALLGNRGEEERNEALARSLFEKIEMDKAAKKVKPTDAGSGGRNGRI